MSKELSKEEFLKRYLENSSDRKRKKKPKSIVPRVSRLKIVDENIDLKSIKFGDKAGGEDDDDEAPVVAEIIDERPLEVKVKELYESSRWKKVDHNENSQADAALGNIISAERNAESNTSEETKHSRNVQNSVKRARHDSGSDISPPRHKKETIVTRHDSNSDASFPRETTQRSKKRNGSDSDISPPRSVNDTSRRNRHSSSDFSPPRSVNDTSRRNRHSSSDLSPPRNLNLSTSRKKVSGRKISSSKSRHRSDSDISPPRYQKNSSNDVPKKTLVRYDSDSDQNSPKCDNSTKRHKIARNSKNKDSDSDLSPPRPNSSKTPVKNINMRPVKTLSGLKAGLQNSQAMRQETQELRKREKTHINMLDDTVSGKNAETIVRDRKTGLKRNLDQERQVIDEENKKAEEHLKKYEKWGKGVEQTQNKINKFEEDLYEMSKPLARYQDDEDLDERLKSIVHDDDPMLKYIKKKKQKDLPTLPMYSGPPPPPNRFNIMPGYRWDGVDRSNGFEKRYFEKLNSTKAVQEEAYLWSVQNM